MRAANKALLILISLAAATAACRQAPPDQNIATENSAATMTDVEALPPDESVATPTEELANGDDETSGVNQSTNSH